MAINIDRIRTRRATLHEITPYNQISGLNLNGIIVLNDKSMGDITNNIIKIEDGKVKMRIDELYNDGNDIVIGPLTVTGGETIQIDVNQQNINIENINPYADQVNLTGRTVFNDNIRFIGLGTDKDGTDHNQTIFIEREFDVDSYELVIFKGANTVDNLNNRIRIDAIDKILFQTGKSTRIWGGGDGVTRFELNDTSAIFSVPIEIDTLNEKTLDTGVTIDSLTLIKDGDIVTSGDITCDELICDTVSEKSVDVGVTIDSVLLKDNIVTCSSIVTDVITTSGTLDVTAGTTTLSGNLTCLGDIVCPTFSVGTLLEGVIDGGVTVEGILLKDNTITLTTDIDVTNLRVDTIVNLSSGNVDIEGTVFTSGGDITTSGQIQANTLIGTSLTVPNIFPAVAEDGVMIDGVIIKSNVIYCDEIISATATYASTAIISFKTDNIAEYTTDAGVGIDGITIRDGEITCNKIICSDYVGPNVKVPCKVASTVNIVSRSGELTIDNIACVAGDRVLLWQQDTASENGIYVVALGPWSRTIDADTTEDLSSALVTVDKGDTYADTIFLCCCSDDIVVDVSPIVWFIMGGIGQAHNTLSSIQGGVLGTEHYHLTLSEHTELTEWVDSVTLSDDGDTIVENLTATTLNGVTIDSTGTPGKWIFDIPAGNMYEFQIGGVPKSQILESSIATDHIYGLDRDVGVTAINKFNVQNEKTGITQVELGSGLGGEDVVLKINGDAYKKSGSSWVISSDKRIKKDIKNFNLVDSKRFIDGLSIKSYKYIDESDSKIGIVAQDVKSLHKKIFKSSLKSPISITKTKKYDDFHNFDSSSLIYHLINYVKLLEIELDKIKQKL